MSQVRAIKEFHNEPKTFLQFVVRELGEAAEEGLTSAQHSSSTFSERYTSRDSLEVLADVDMVSIDYLTHVFRNSHLGEPATCEHFPNGS